MPRAAGKNTAGKDDGFMSSVSRFWNRSYAADYVGFALLLLAYGLVSYQWLKLLILGSAE